MDHSVPFTTVIDAITADGDGDSEFVVDVVLVLVLDVVVLVFDASSGEASPCPRSGPTIYWFPNEFNTFSASLVFCTVALIVLVDWVVPLFNEVIPTELSTSDP